MDEGVKKPKAFGVGLIALDLVMGADPDSPVGSWAGGTCGNVLSILAYLGWDAFPIARMNGDPASERVRADMVHWGVRLDFSNCAPTSHTPDYHSADSAGPRRDADASVLLVVPTLRPMAAGIQGGDAWGRRDGGAASPRVAHDLFHGSCLPRST